MEILNNNYYPEFIEYFKNIRVFYHLEKTFWETEKINKINLIYLKDPAVVEVFISEKKINWLSSKNVVSLSVEKNKVDATNLDSVESNATLKYSNILLESKKLKYSFKHLTLNNEIISLDSLLIIDPKKIFFSLKMLVMKKLMEISAIHVTGDILAWWNFFQPPASYCMVAIIEFHNYIMIILLFIFWALILVSNWIYNTIYFNKYISENKTYIPLKIDNVAYSYNNYNFFKKKVYFWLEFSRWNFTTFKNFTILELIWTTIPSIVIAFIGFPSFTLLYSLELHEVNEFIVKAIGHQWYWSYEMLFFEDPWDKCKKTIKENQKFSYINLFKIKEALNANFGSKNICKVNFDSYMLSLEDIIIKEQRLLSTDHPLVLPVNFNIRLNVTSADVLHAFAVPSLGIKIDAVPGRLNAVYFNIFKPGKFYGQCSELCGVNHGFMPIEIRALTGSTSSLKTDLNIYFWNRFTSRKIWPWDFMNIKFFYLKI